jgi:RNA polymerase sigma-70 factor (ECF subfamily)
MPPWREWYVGRATIAEFLGWVWRPDRGARERLVSTAANGQPAFAHYRWRHGDAGWRPFAIQVLELDDHHVSSIVNFVDPALFASFGLVGVSPDRLGATTIPTDESKPPR